MIKVQLSDESDEQGGDLPKNVGQTKTCRTPKSIDKTADFRCRLQQVVRIMDLEFPNLYRFSWQADRQSQYVLAPHFWHSVPNSPTTSDYDLL